MIEGKETAEISEHEVVLRLMLYARTMARQLKMHDTQNNTVDNPDFTDDSQIAGRPQLLSLAEER